MNRDAFLIYLKDLRDLEFAKNAIMKTYNKEKDKFNDRARQLNQTNYHKLDDLGDPVVGLIASIIICAVCTLIAVKIRISFFGVLIKILCAIFGLTCFACIFYCLFLMARSANNNRHIRAHNREEDTIAAEHQKELSVVRNLWNSQAAHLQKQFDKVDSLLENGYSLNIIPAPYRNLASMYYIYDYMSTSQASFEDTLMHEHMENGIQRILSRLDTIIAQNEQIIFQNRQLEAQNRQMIERTDRMLASLQRTEQNTLAGAQYAKISAQHTQTIAVFKEMEFWDNYSKRR